VVECVGPTIRTWVNGVPAADVIDPLDLEGHIALQVHSGNDTEVVWSSIELWDRGQASWTKVKSAAILNFSPPPQRGGAGQAPDSAPAGFVEETEAFLYGLEVEQSTSSPMNGWIHGLELESHPALGSLAVAARPEGSLVIRVEDWSALPTLALPHCSAGSTGGKLWQAIALDANWSEDQVMLPFYESLLAGPALAISADELRSLVETRSKRSKYAVADAKADFDEVVLSRYGDRVAVHVNGWLVASLGCHSPGVELSMPVQEEREPNEVAADESIKTLNANTRYLSWDTGR
jgi:hypothetical protein